MKLSNLKSKNKKKNYNKWEVELIVVKIHEKPVKNKNKELMIKSSKTFCKKEESCSKEKEKSS